MVTPRNLQQVRSEITNIVQQQQSAQQANQQAIAALQKQFPQGVPKSRTLEQSRIFSGERERLTARQTALKQLQTQLQRAGRGAEISKQEAEKFIRQVSTAELRGVTRSERERIRPIEQREISQLKRQLASGDLTLEEEIGADIRLSELLGPRGRIGELQAFRGQKLEESRRLREEARVAKIPEPTKKEPLRQFDARLEPFRQEDFDVDFIKAPLSKRAKDKFISTIKGLGSLPFATSSALAQVFETAETQLAEQGRFIPTKDEQILGGKRETLEFLPEFLTDKELENLSFGGLNILVKREQAKLDFKTNNIIKQEVKSLEPQFQANVQAVIDEFEAERLTETQANNQLKNLEKSFKQNVLDATDPKIDVSQENVQSFIDAVERGDIENVEQHLEADIDINQVKTESGDTLLMIALENGYTDMALLFIQAGIDLYSVNKQGYSALQFAKIKGYDDILGLIKNQNQNDFKLIQIASTGNFLEIESLIQKDAQVNAINEIGETALIKACQNGYLDIVELLLANGANANLYGRNYTPLIYACLEGQNLVIVKVLLENNARVLSEIREGALKGENALTLVEKKYNESSAYIEYDVETMSEDEYDSLWSGLNQELTNYRARGLGFETSMANMNLTSLKVSRYYWQVLQMLKSALHE